MALRASYYGLKKRILDKVLGDYDAAGVMTNKELTKYIGYPCACRSVNNGNNVNIKLKNSQSYIIFAYSFSGNVPKTTDFVIAFAGGQGTTGNIKVIKQSDEISFTLSLTNNGVITVNLSSSSNNWYTLAAYCLPILYVGYDMV